MGVLSNISDWFWDETFWLPEHASWDLMKPSKGNYGQASDLVVVLPIAVIVFCVRMFVECVIATRIGKKLQLSDKPKKTPQKSIVLEKVYKSVTKNPTDTQLEGLCKQSNWSKHKVQAWFRRRKNVGKSSTLVKFRETFWRFTFYFLSFLFGIYVLHDEECIWNRQKCWGEYPKNHELSKKIYWYYMIELGFYTTTTVTQFFDIKRKDFWEMFIHHIVTIILMMGSYVMNYTKIGAFIVIVHDSADFYLEFAKMGKYANYTLTTNIGFALFTLAFFASRLTILPFWIIPTIWFDGIVGYAPYSVMYFLFSALLTLQVLHFYWFTHIVRVVYSSILVGGIERDTRSDSEGESSNEESETLGNGSKIKSSGDFGDPNGVHKRQLRLKEGE